MIWSLSLGLAILALVFWDLFLTIFSLRGGGPATNRIGEGVWRLMLSVHRKRPIHQLLSLAGPFILILVVLFWYFLTALSWFLIFISQTTSVINNNTQVSTSLLEKLYFTGVTVSDLGYGDLVPQAFPWTLMSSLAALTGTLILSAALSYILPVISVGLQKRVIAKSIHGMGKTSEEMIVNIWLKGGQEIRAHLLSTLNQLQSFTLQHRSYPILLFFHSATPDQSLTLAVIKFSDAMFLATQGTAKEAPTRNPSLGGFEAVAKGTIHDFSLLDDAEMRRSNNPNLEVPAHLSFEVLSHLGVDAGMEDNFREALDEYLPLRARLCRLCERDGWDPDSGI